MTNHRRLYAQGDILIERVEDIDPTRHAGIEADPDGAVVLARGEVTGHRHAILRGALMFRDDGLARDMPRDLYVGHVRVTGTDAQLRHEEHAAITLPRGTYRIRRQREFEPAAALGGSRLVED